MLDLSSIQDDYLKEYLSLEHLRAFIYKSKLDKGKTKGINEENFYGVTCAQDVLALFKREEGRNNIPRCYLLHPITKSLDKVEYSHLISYLEYLVYTQIDTTSFRYNPDAMTAYEISCENESIKFDNKEFYFRRDEIENMIGAKIPQIENLSDVENVDLIPLQKEKAESVPELNQEIERLKSELEEKQKIIDSLSLTNQSGRISSPQKQLFALLVKKCYPKLDSRNKLFDVINADLKDSEIRNTDISADTFYKLIDESNDIIKAIFPPKKS